MPCVGRLVVNAPIYTSVIPAKETVAKSVFETTKDANITKNKAKAFVLLSVLRG